MDVGGWRQDRQPFVQSSDGWIGGPILSALAEGDAGHIEVPSSCYR